MTQNTIRIVAAGIAISAFAVISAPKDNSQSGPHSLDPSVPAAWDVFHANDGRAEGNTEDKTY